MDPVSMAAVGGAYAVNNIMSEVHASNQAKRDAALMRQQNALNKSNILGAYADKVSGLKMAGLNPALAADGATPAVATASKASAGMAENVELDPASLLLKAQADNLSAQTAKTKAETAKIEGVDTKNVQADTDLKTAQKLFTGANQTKVEAETTNLGNVNKVFQEENSAMSLFGQTTAQGWQKESWYEKLPKGAKMVIDDIAKGDFDLTVGFANALNRMIDTDSAMNAVEKDKVTNALTRAVVEAQMKSPKVMKALSKTPEAQYNSLINQASKLAAETNSLRFDLGWSKDRKKVWEHNDPDKLYSEYIKDPTLENAAKWLVGSMRSNGAEVVKSTAPAAIHGTMMQKGMENSAKTKSQSSSWSPFPGGRTNDPGDLQYNSGVQDFKYKQRKW